jgi:glycosyltransferase 2 family protein
MRPRLRNVLLHVGSLVLGGGLLYLALRGVPFESVGEALQAANYWYLLPLAAIALLSHALRAWRWLLLLDVLPATGGPAGGHQRPGFWPAYFSLLIGYMVNYAAPRLGEVARSANLAAQSSLTFSGVLGTVVVERILDVLTLALAVAVALVVATRQVQGLHIFVEPMSALVDEPPVALWMLAVLGLAVAVGSILVLRALVRWASGREGIAGYAASAVRSFRSGLLSLARTRRPVALVLSTAAIWFCYLLLAYLPLPMLGITGLSLADALVLLVVGSAAMIVPAPGGVGSYHYVTIQTMTRLFAVPLASATAYAVLSHAAQLILYTAAGFASLLLQGRGIAVRVTPPAESAP